MVLESIISPWKAETHPSRLILFGFLYATLGIFLSSWIFNEHASLVMVFLTTMACIPLVYNLIKVEEKKDLSELKEQNILKEHGKALLVFLNLFIGATIAFAFWYTVLPGDMVSNMFEIQTNTLTSIRSRVTGQATGSAKAFFDILSNNLKVLIFCILFSFLYGVGAIFILTWNASVIGVAIGDLIRTGIYQIEKRFFLLSAHEYVGITVYGLLRYALHGVVEIGGYFVAGLAGGIISIATIRHDFGTKKYEKIILDASLLLLFSLLLIFVAAFLEVYVTPLIF